MKKEKLTLIKAESDLEQVKKAKNDLYNSVKDFGSADYTKTENALKAMGRFNSEIKRLEKKIKELS